MNTKKFAYMKGTQSPLSKQHTVSNTVHTLYHTYPPRHSLTLLHHLGS